MKIRFDIVGADALRAALARVQSGINEAASKALNDAAFKARARVQGEMKSRFDRPTPYIVRSVYVDQAKPDNLVAAVRPKYFGGKGIDPSNVLAHHTAGGARKMKASERQLQRVGILPTGFMIAPGPGAPIDSFGNVPGRFMATIVRYFGAASEVGSKSNMTDKSKRRMAKVGRSAAGFKRINGVEYFATLGRLRGGHLAPGIYSRKGTHGSNIVPVLLFVRRASYSTRFPFHDIAADGAADDFGQAISKRMGKLFDGAA